MHDPERLAVGADALVRVVQARAQAGDQRQRRIERDSAVALLCLCGEVVEILAMDVLHREEELAVVDADVVDLRDVRVLQRRGEPRFVDEHRDEAAVARELRQDPFDHDQLLEAFDPDRARQIELGHAADRDLTN